MENRATQKLVDEDSIPKDQQSAFAERVQLNWDEAPIEEKVRRTREVVKIQQMKIDYLEDLLHGLQRQFQLHQHHGDRTLVDVREVGAGVGHDLKRPEPKRVYF